MPLGSLYCALCVLLLWLRAVTMCAVCSHCMCCYYMGCVHSAFALLLVHYLCARTVCRHSPHSVVTGVHSTLPSTGACAIHPHRYHLFLTVSQPSVSLWFVVTRIAGVPWPETFRDAIGVYPPLLLDVNSLSGLLKELKTKILILTLDSLSQISCLFDCLFVTAFQTVLLAIS